MKTKSIALSGIVASIIQFMLGWLFYGILFPDIYPSEGENENLMLIYLGCLGYAVMLAYILINWVKPADNMGGAMAALTVGVLNAFQMNMFMYSGMAMNVKNICLDVAITALCSAILGYVITMMDKKSG